MARRRIRTHDIYLPNKKEQADEDRRSAAAKKPADRAAPSKPPEKPAEKKKPGFLKRLTGALEGAARTAKRGAPARGRSR